ncbi:hypothetical protein K438DRAFT_2022146 [Mycena galopus ATCC 62051]|nr:hypothetical protein K438DRAFT_2022146 [Mycena galopus ATCC 62051]
MARVGNANEQMWDDIYSSNSRDGANATRHRAVLEPRPLRLPPRHLGASPVHRTARLVGFPPADNWHAREAATTCAMVVGSVRAYYLQRLPLPSWRTRGADDPRRLLLSRFTDPADPSPSPFVLIFVLDPRHTACLPAPHRASDSSRRLRPIDMLVSAVQRCDGGVIRAAQRTSRSSKCRRCCTPEGIHDNGAEIEVGGGAGA